MACGACGKKHPLSPDQKLARQFAGLPRRKFGKLRTPPTPPMLPTPHVEEVVEPKVEDSNDTSTVHP